MNNTNLGIERSFEEFKADKKRKWQEFFSSSSEDSQSDNDNSFLVGTGSQNCVNLPTKNFSAGKLDNDENYKSSSSKKGACQHWNRLCLWWDANKSAAIPELLNLPDIFPHTSSSQLTKPISEVMFRTTHLQRAHLLSAYAKTLMPKKENLTHLSGNSIKNYIDAIARKMRVIENQKLTTSSFYGNWSWSTDNQYQILRDTISKKVNKEDKQFRGKKEKSQNLSDSITSRSWRVLIKKTLEKWDRFRELGDLPSFIKTNASVCVHIITYFCGCRVQQEVADVCAFDFTDLSPNLIRFDQSGDSKTRKLTSNYTFVERESCFIFGQIYCNPLRIFLNKRPPNSIDRFFLYALPSARFDHSIWLTAAMPIGLKPLSKAVKSEVDGLVTMNLIPAGNYSNTSLRKGLSTTLALAHVPPFLIDCMLGHHCSKTGNVASHFTSMPNLLPYTDVYKQELTRKKLGLILFDEQLTWFDISNEDLFHEAYMNYFPSDFKTANNAPLPSLVSSNPEMSPMPAFELDGSLDLEKFDFDSFPCVSPKATSSPKTKPDSSDEWDSLILSLVSPTRKPAPTSTNFQQSNGPAVPPPTYAQTNNAVSIAGHLAPNIHIHGGTVNFTFVTQSGSERRFS